MNRYWIIAAILVTYGSLYPFEFFTPPDWEQELSSILNFRILNARLTDSFANVLLFIPLGLLFSYSQPKRPWCWVRFLFITFLLAYFIQVVQIWMPKRYAFGGDAIWNLLGACLGLTIRNAFLSLFYGSTNRLSGVFCPYLSVFFGLLLVDTLPFIPTLDPQQIKLNILGLASISNFSPIVFCKYMVYFWLTGLFWRQSKLSEKFHYLVYFILLSFLVSKIFIQSSQVSFSHVLALPLGLLLSSLTIDSVFKHTFFSKLVLLWIFFNGLGSFVFGYNSSAINLVPFAPALNGNILISITAFIIKGFYYYLYFTISDLEGKTRTSTLMNILFLVSALELFQLNIKGSTSDITEIIVLFWVYSIANKYNLLRASSSDAIIERADTLDTTGILKVLSRRFISPIMFVAIVTSSIAVFMSLPGLPYNIAELFKNTNKIESYFFASATMLFLGIGVSYISQKLHSGQLSVYKLGLFGFLLSCSLLLGLNHAFTGEAIADINGSANITYQLSKERIMNEFGVWLVESIGTNTFRNISAIIEPYIRFGALLGPLIYGLIIMHTLVLHPQTSNIKFSLTPLNVLNGTIILILWFTLCKVIVFDYSSTDNLNELIAREGMFGLGGGGYLYLLCFTICAQSIVFERFLNKRSLKTFSITVLCLAFFIPLSWKFVNLGLVQEFTKYGNSFSGVDFLIGGSRYIRLSQEVLFLRWLGFFVALTLGFAISIKLGATLIGDSLPTHAKTITKNTQNNEFAVNFSKYKRGYMFNVKLIGFSALVAIVIAISVQQHVKHKVETIAWAGEKATIIFDHHTHSKYSDGDFSIEQVAAFAEEQGCNAIAFSDHTDVKRSRTPERLNDIQQVRKRFGNLLIMAGAELNPPSYAGREHVNIMVSPNVEDTFFNEFYKKLDQKAFKTDDQLFNYIGSSNGDNESLFLIYNHPSRKDGSEQENFNDYVNWSASSKNSMIGFSGAPGHQRSFVVGSYYGSQNLINRWDPAVAKVNGTLDKLLESGEDVFGAIASSDFHNNKLDYKPCEFSRIHVSAPSYDYDGLIKAMKMGTFWASHGKFLNQYQMSLSLGLDSKAYFPGETLFANKGEIAYVDIDFGREIDEIDNEIHVDLITNCTNGKPEALEKLIVKGYQNKASALLPLNTAGTDAKSCFLRSRASLIKEGKRHYSAYTNHIRINLN